MAGLGKEADCCRIGKAWEGEPQGKQTTIASLDAYVSEPAQPSGKAVLMISGTRATHTVKPACGRCHGKFSSLRYKCNLLRLCWASPLTAVAEAACQQMPLGQHAMPANASWPACHASKCLLACMP